MPKYQFSNYTIRQQVSQAKDKAGCHKAWTSSPWDNKPTSQNHTT
jgi:hypothetical protein